VSLNKNLHYKPNILLKLILCLFVQDILQEMQIYPIVRILVLHGIQTLELEVTELSGKK
jgi:hypothetical protein